MAVRDFKGFRKAPPLPAGIPIIGDGPQSLPPQVRDALNRILAEGDLILLQTVNLQPYKIVKIAPLPAGPTQPPGLMDVVLQSTVRFAAVRDQPNAEFVRIMPAADAAAVRAVPVDKPDAVPIGPDKEIPNGTREQRQVASPTNTPPARQDGDGGAAAGKAVSPPSEISEDAPSETLKDA